jgi:hypothetical protein
MVWHRLIPWVDYKLLIGFRLGCSLLTVSFPYLLLWQGSSFYLMCLRLAIHGTWLRKWAWYSFKKHFLRQSANLLKEIALAKKRMELEGRENRQPYTKAKIKKIFSTWHIYFLTVLYMYVFIKFIPGLIPLLTWFIDPSTTLTEANPCSHSKNLH